VAGIDKMKIILAERLINQFLSFDEKLFDPLNFSSDGELLK
jgi:hypothetical protein